MTKPRDIHEIHEAVNDAVDRHMKYIAPEATSPRSKEFILLLKLQVITLMLEERAAWQEVVDND